MPAHKKTLSKVAQSATKKNTAVLMNLDEMPGAVIARIDANLGSYFRLTYHNGETTTQILGSPRGLFKQRKAQIRFSRDDIVVISSVPSRASDITEIIALLSKKDAQDLYTKGRIHKNVYSAPSAWSAVESAAVEDDLFDYTTEGATGEDFDINSI
jgi:hypothetical protein